VPSGSHSDPTGDRVEGFRYYLPKPYLLVTNMTVLPTPGASTTPKPESKATAPSGETPDQQKPKDQEKSKGTEQPVKEGSVITAQLIWLPDLKRQYAISVRGGRTGSFKGALQLANGWMLVGVNEEFDTKTAETLSAFTGFLGTLFAASGLPTAAAKGLAAQAATPIVREPFLYLFEIDIENRRLISVDSSALQQALKERLPTDATAPKDTSVPKETPKP
jgi:hypothetical protein